MKVITESSSRAIPGGGARRPWSTPRNTTEHGILSGNMSSHTQLPKTHSVRVRIGTIKSTGNVTPENFSRQARSRAVAAFNVRFSDPEVQQPRRMHSPKTNPDGPTGAQLHEGVVRFSLNNASRQSSASGVSTLTSVIKKLKAESDRRRKAGEAISIAWRLASKYYSRGQVAEKERLQEIQKLVSARQEQFFHSTQGIVAKRKLAKIRALVSENQQIMLHRNAMVLALGSLMNIYQGVKVSESIDAKFQDLEMTSSKMKQLLKQLKHQMPHKSDLSPSAVVPAKLPNLPSKMICID